MFRSFFIILLAAWCIAQPTIWKRQAPVIQPNIPGGGLPGLDLHTSNTTSASVPSQTPVNPPQINIRDINGYQIFAEGAGSCKQGFIGTTSAPPTCWSSTCGSWRVLQVRNIYNASITAYSSTTCTGSAEKINPICAIGNTQQDCNFASGRFRSFRVIPGCQEKIESPVCAGGLQESNCSGGNCLGAAGTS